ncbi:MAG: hypothetical protein ACOYL3_07870 [Desulfuromonadaceae bacterium]
MKKFVLLVMSLLLVFAVNSFAVDSKSPTGKFDAKSGDTIYVCACGDGCDCGSLAHKAGKCGCGKELVKTTVDKIEKGRAFYKVDGKEMSSPVQGKFTCGCGDGCDCGTVSQKAGKCACDKDMVKVSKTKKAAKKAPEKEAEKK